MLSFILIGLLVGSFSNVLIERLPKIIKENQKQKLNLFFPRSHCPQCKNTIAWYDLIPVLSWIILKRKCRYCKVKISIQYPVIEIAHALAWAIVSSNHNTNDAVIWCVFISIAINLAIIDTKHFLLPNVLIYTLAATGLILSTTQIQLINLQESITGGTLGYLILYIVGKYYQKIKGKVILGGGDVKYVGALGTWFGPISIPYILIIASCTAITVTVAIQLIKKKSLNDLKNQFIPLGLYLSISALIMYCYHFGIFSHSFSYIL